MKTGKLISLAVELRSGGEGRFSFGYRAHNDSGHEVYLFNRLFWKDKTGKRTIDQDRVYCSIVGDVLHLSKRLVRVPAGVKVEMPEIPYLTHLPPGATFQEDISIATPMRVDVPYMSRSSVPERPILCKKMVFSLGYFVAREPRWIKSIHKGEEVILATDYGFAIQADEVVSAQPMDVNVQGLAS